VTADIRRTDADSTEADDWLGDEASLDWDADATEGRAPAVATSDAPSGTADALTLRRRRLLAGLAMVVLIGLGIGIAFALTGGGDSNAEETIPTTLPTTTQAPPPTTTPATTTPAAPTVKLPASGTMRRGDSGAEVKTLQQSLKTIGYDPGPVDGSYGATTETAVAQFQQAQGLPPDGVVGKETAAAINEELAKKSGV